MSDTKWIEAPTCSYCTEPSRFCGDSSEVYRRNYGPIWICRPCQAWVGCHPGTRKPLGRLADAALRRLKMAAHASFDPLWKGRQMSRSQAYRWLAEQLGISCDECHIGMFDEAMCRRVVEVIGERRAATV